MAVTSLASYRHCCDRVTRNWPAFAAKRTERLAQHSRFGTAAEKVAENVVEDLFTMVLDRPLSAINNQVAYADMVLTRSGIKHLLIELKRPGALAWNEGSVGRALDQAHRYADEQKVRTIAVSDGIMLYARDHTPNGPRDRVFVRLDSDDPPLDLWWLSLDGIYRPRTDGGGALRLLPPDHLTAFVPAQPGSELLHPKYRLPARCFAYVGNAADPKTWHLPYLRADGRPDLARLPKAIQAILSNYRGAHVRSVPEVAIPDVLVTLARCAFRVGRLPVAGPDAATAYVQLHEALDQLGRLSEASAGARDG